MSISNIDKIREKVEKLKKLADAMYYAAQYLTTDASRLHKAMDKYRNFIIHEWREEPVSEELEEAADNALESISDQYDIISVGSCLEMFKRGAKWQKQKTIEKACEYLDLHCNEVKTEDNGIAGWIDNEFINNFKQAMKDE